MRGMKAIAFLGTRPPWIIGLLVAFVAALRASEQFVLAWLCLAGAALLLSGKIIHSALGHVEFPKSKRIVLACLGTAAAIGLAVAIGWGLRPPSPPMVPAVVRANSQPSTGASSPEPERATR